MTNKFSFIFAILFILTSCSGDNDSRGLDKVDVATINRKINVGEFQGLLKNNINIQLIDVRTKEEYDQGTFPNAVNIDYLKGDFQDQLLKLDNQKPTLIFCHSGGRSGKASEVFSGLGFIEVYDLIGGYSMVTN